MVTDFKTYDEVANDIGLSGNKRKRFLRYMRMRWSSNERAQCLIGYAYEWAMIFYTGMEWIVSDREGQKVLANVDKELLI